MSIDPNTIGSDLQNTMDAEKCMIMGDGSPKNIEYTNGPQFQFGVPPCTCTLRLAGIAGEGDMYGSDTPCPVHDNVVSADGAESLALLKETERLIGEINGITSRMAAVNRTYPRHPKEARIEGYRRLYDQRREKILRIQEINKICIEKGYIQA